MNFSRVLWEALGRQRWFSAGRQRPSRRPPLGRHSRRAPPPLSPGAPRALLVSLTAVYNASRLDKCDIEDARLKELTKEMGQLEILKAATLVCKTCQKRLLIDKPVSNKLYCQCENNKAVEDESGWQPFLETEDIIIWRREEDPGTGLYAYKVYGRYPEVTAVDFLAMHTDLAYWRSWDDTVLGLRKLKQPPSHHLQQDVIHWETLWPRFFNNRDYVYVRRYAYMDSEGSTRPMPPKKVHNINSNSNDAPLTRNTVKSDIQNQSTNFDSIQKKINQENQNSADMGYSPKDRSKVLPDGGKILVENRAYNSDKGRRFRARSLSKVIVMSSQSCEHPDAPETKRAFRVKRYWSNLVIKPFKEVDQPGIEFSLTYFDDPGTSIPSALQSWVAGHACPDFLDKMRHAAASYNTTAHQDTSIMDEIMKANKVDNNPVNNEVPAHTQVSEANVDPARLKESLQSADLQNQLPLKSAKINSSQVDESLAPAKKPQSTITENDRYTEEFLNLLYGRPSELDPSRKTKQGDVVEKSDENNNRVDCTEEKIIIEEIITVDNVKIDESKINERPRVELTVKAKVVLQEQRNDAQTKDPGMSYWHVWPLYYFA